jgi:Uma2 family endonuclease
MPEARKSDEFLSVEEYLEGEKIAEVRHEYLGGEVRAMAGGTRRHNRIAGNIFSDLERSLEGDPCQTYIGDVKVKVSSLQHESFYYPDVMVGCEADDDHALYLDSPRVIFEVLSDSTESIDRREKFFAYRCIPTLMEYVLISQDAMEVTVTRREQEWKPEVISSESDVLELPSMEQSLSLSRIYRNISF